MVFFKAVRLLKQITIFLFLATAPLLAAGPSKAQPPNRSTDSPNSQDQYVKPPMNEAITSPRTAVPMMKLNTGLGGVTVPNAGTGLNVTAQLGFTPAGSTRFYFGPDVDFSIFQVGSALSVMGSCWKEFPFRGGWGPSVNFGLSAGIAYTWTLASYQVNEPTGFLDVSFSETINELANIRFQVRPGFIGSHFAGLIRINVQFRFF